jgi:hypothetical protein
MESRQRFGIWMIADDHRNRAVEFAGLIPVEDIGQAMQVLRDEDRDTGNLGHRTEASSASGAQAAVVSNSARNAAKSNPGEPIRHA